MRFAEGGLVGTDIKPTLNAGINDSNSNTNTNNITININIAQDQNGNTTVTNNQDKSSTSQENRQKEYENAKNLSRQIESAVIATIEKQSRPGGLLTRNNR